MDCSARSIVRPLLLVPVTPYSGDKSVYPKPPTLSLCMGLIRQPRPQFRGVERGTSKGLTSGISCLPHAHLSHGSAILPQEPSGTNASLELPDDHKHFIHPDHTVSGQEINASSPYKVQTGVCPQFRPTFTQQTAVVHATQGRIATAPAAVIPHHFLDAENAFSRGKEDPPRIIMGKPLRDPSTCA